MTAKSRVRKLMKKSRRKTDDGSTNAEDICKKDVTDNSATSGEKKARKKA